MFTIISLKLRISSLFLAVGLPAFCMSATLSGSQPNILWIIAEDLSPDLGCYGETVAKTPHIDALAAEGVRFTQVIGTSSVCSVNRSAFHTAMYQTSIASQNHRTDPRPMLPEGVRTLPAYFRAAGYYVSNGAGAFDPDNPAWPLTVPGKVDWNFSAPDGGFDGPDWAGRADGQPFFAQINIAETHRDWTPDKKRPIDPADVTIPPYYPDHPLVRKDWASYLEEAQILDDKVATILQRLEDERVADNTIVFFFGDNGRPFCRGKIFVYEAGLRVPLIIRYPDGRQAGSVDDRLISMIDLLPTTMEMAGIARPPHFHGKSFLNSGPIHRSVVYAAKDRVGSFPDRIRAVRDTRYKYIRNYRPEMPYLPGNRYSLLMHPSLAALLMLGERGELNAAQQPFAAKRKPVEELYDLQNDPWEIHNLAADPAQHDRLVAFRAQLEAWIEFTDDQGAEPEPESSYVPYRNWLDDLERDYLKRYGLDALTPENMYAYWMQHYGYTESD